MFSCLLYVQIILKLNAKQVSEEIVLAHIPRIKQMLQIFSVTDAQSVPYF